MRQIIQALSALALAGTVVAPALFYTGTLAEESLRNCVLATTLLWFATAPFWMEYRRH